jgi:hypothetical protein
MESFEKFNQKPEKGSSAVFWIVAAVAAVLVIGIVAFLVTRPTTDEARLQAIEGALREGSPGFDAITKKLAVENDEDRTSESPTAMGTIQMSIWGKIRNLSTDKTIIGLEIKVTVVDLTEKAVKEKTVIVIPQQQPTLNPSEEMPVHIIMDGFQKTDNRANIHWKVTAIKTN